MYKQDLALKRQQWYVYHKTQPNPTKANENIYL